MKRQKRHRIIQNAAEKSHNDKMSVEITTSSTYPMLRKNVKRVIHKLRMVFGW